MTPEIHYPTYCYPRYTNVQAEIAPYIVTRASFRNSLGDCIIATGGAQFIAKIHAFKTNARSRSGLAEKECARLTRFFAYARSAEHIGRCADDYDVPIRKAVEMSKGDDYYKGIEGYAPLIPAPARYDAELDTPRLMIKVPGMNVFLTFEGSLRGFDAYHELNGVVSSNHEPLMPESYYSREDVKRTIGHTYLQQVYDTLRQMAEWYPHTLQKRARGEYATRTDDHDRIHGWLQYSWARDVQNLDHPHLPVKRGPGYDPNIMDNTRRPETQLLHIADKDEHDAMRARKNDIYQDAYDEEVE